MLDEFNGTPDRAINPPDIDDIADQYQAPSEIVYDFLNGQFVDEIDLNDVSDKELANDYLGFIEIYRHFKFDKDLTRDENRYELLTEINDYLTETLLGYVK